MVTGFVSGISDSAIVHPTPREHIHFRAGAFPLERISRSLSISTNREVFANDVIPYGLITVLERAKVNLAEGSGLPPESNYGFYIQTQRDELYGVPLVEILNRQEVLMTVEGCPSVTVPVDESTPATLAVIEEP